MKTITITTEKMFRNFVASMTDLIWDEPERTPYDIYIKILETLSEEKMEPIRQRFIDGYTTMLLGELMAQIECRDNTNEIEEHEIRIINNEGKLIGVIINSEINY
jgi:hypothetical protein